MPPRKRAYIRKDEKIAAALACMMPAGQRDALRAARVPAKAVLKLFEWDHIVLHTHKGSDLWWNLDPKAVVLHKEKSRRDTSIVAKVDRIIAKRAQHEERRKRVLKPRPGAVTTKQIFSLRWPKNIPLRWPTRKIPSRPFRRALLK